MNNEEDIVDVESEEIGSWVVELITHLNGPLVRVTNTKLGYFTEDYFLTKDDADTAFYMAVALLQTTVEG